MENILKKVVKRANSVFKETANRVLDNWNKTDQKNIEANAIYIKDNSNTTVSTKTLLGITFTEFTLVENNKLHVLVTKGTNADYILELSIYNKDETFLLYRSYLNN